MHRSSYLVRGIVAKLTRVTLHPDTRVWGEVTRKIWLHVFAINNNGGSVPVIDILGPRLPTHTWRGRHMYEESKMASSTGQKTRELYYEK